MIDKEFPGNVRITISEHETRIWVCGAYGCKFRFKAMAKAQQSSEMDYLLLPQHYNNELVSIAERVVKMLSDQPDVPQLYKDAKAVLEKVK